MNVYFFESIIIISHLTLNVRRKHTQTIRNFRLFHSSLYHAAIALIASRGQRNVTVWRPSVCLSRRHTHRDSQ